MEFSFIICLPALKVGDQLDEKLIYLILVVDGRFFVCSLFFKCVQSLSDGNLEHLLIYVFLLSFEVRDELYLVGFHQDLAEGVHVALAFDEVRGVHSVCNYFHLQFVLEEARGFFLTARECFETDDFPVAIRSVLVLALFEAQVRHLISLDVLGVEVAKQNGVVEQVELEDEFMVVEHQINEAES